MLATPERVRDEGLRTEALVWHKPTGPVVEDFQAIACSVEEGIVLPWARKDVPLKLDEPGERWCADCLAVIRASKEASDG
jgi:hypothetical protein